MKGFKNCANFSPRPIFAETRNLLSLRMSDTTPGEFWFIFNVPTKCNYPWMSLKCSSSSVFRMWTKKKRIFCNFPSTFLKPVEKIVPAYIYICLFLYLPICLLSILFIDSVDDRCLFAYFYICNNCKVWISYCHKFILTPVSSPCCVQKVKKNVCSNHLQDFKSLKCPPPLLSGKFTFSLKAGLHHKHTWSKTAIIHICSMLMSA